MEKYLNNTENLTELEYQIYKLVNDIVVEYHKESINSIPWATESIKKKIGDLGLIRNHTVASTIHQGEWMYDLTWINKNKKGFWEEVPLILESEISTRKPEGLIFDFSKLLISNAKTRVFISLAKSGSKSSIANVNHMVKLYQEAFDSFKNPVQDCRILVLIWEDYIKGEIFPHLLTK